MPDARCDTVPSIHPSFLPSILLTVSWRTNALMPSAHTDAPSNTDLPAATFLFLTTVFPLAVGIPGPATSLTHVLRTSVRTYGSATALPHHRHHHRAGPGGGVRHREWQEEARKGRTRKAGVSEEHARTSTSFSPLSTDPTLSHGPLALQQLVLELSYCK